MTQTALYRCFDEAGTLLYVGISNDPEARFKSHAGEKEWWSEVASHLVVWHTDRREALIAEAAAIRAEAPRYNGNLGSPEGRGKVAPPKYTERLNAKVTPEMLERLLEYTDANEGYTTSQIVRIAIEHMLTSGKDVYAIIREIRERQG